MDSKKTILSLATLILLNINLFSQKVDIDKVKFSVAYTDLPVRKVNTDLQYFTVNVMNSNSVKFFISSEEISNRVHIQGYKRQLEHPEAFKINIEIGEFMIHKNEITSNTTESKSKDGTVTKKTTYQLSIIHSLGGSYSVKDATGNPMIDRSNAGRNSQQTYTSSEFDTYTAASNYARDNSVALKTNFIKDGINQIIRDVNYYTTNLYGYSKENDNDHVWILDSKKRPEYESFQQATKDLVDIFKTITLTEIPENTSEKVKPIVEYFEKIAALPNEEKADRKLVYAANYNLATLSYWLDKPTLTKKYGEAIIANDYDKRDGEDFIKKAENLLKKFEISTIKSRHFVREIPGEEYTYQSQANTIAKTTAAETVIIKKATPSIIVNKDDSELEGYIINYSNSDPWEIQKSVRFVAAADYNEGKYDKKVVQKFDPKEIKAFTYDKKVYIPIYYSSMESGSVSLGSKWYFAEVLVKGKIVKLLSFYDSPAGFQVGSLGEMERQKAELLKKGPGIILLEEGEEKARNLTTMGLEKIIEKNTELFKMYIAGEYSKDKKPVDMKRGLIEKLSARTELDDNIDFMRLFNDLNGIK
jgi:hypothetical protein